MRYGLLCHINFDVGQLKPGEVISNASELRGGKKQRVVSRYILHVDIIPHEVHLATRQHAANGSSILTISLRAWIQVDLHILVLGRLKPSRKIITRSGLNACDS